MSPVFSNHVKTFLFSVNDSQLKHYRVVFPEPLILLRNASIFVVEFSVVIV